MNIKKYLKKVITYLRNKFFYFNTLNQIKRNAPKKIINSDNFMKKLLGKNKEDKIKISFKDGFHLFCSSNDLGAIAETCVTEDYQQKVAVEIQPGNIVFDIGAHIGSFSIYAANKGAIVYAFEPDKDNYLKLLANIKLNNYVKVITPFNYGIYSFTGELELDIASDNKGGHSLLTNNSNSKLSIPVKKLSKVLTELKISNIDLMKIDIEGAEYEIFKNFDVQEISAINRIVGEYHLIPEYKDYNFKSLKNTLSPNYRTVEKYWSYNFYVTK